MVQQNEGKETTTIVIMDVLEQDLDTLYKTIDLKLELFNEC